MNKIRKFFGIGRKPRERVQKTQFDFPENFIVGSTDQKAFEEDLLRSETRSKLDTGKKIESETADNKKKVLR